VGRVALPLARECAHVVAVDASPVMLHEARANCDRDKVKNVELVLSDDQLSKVRGPFDLIHSVIVFQHLPPRRGLSILRAMMDRLADGGVGALHFTYARDASWFRKLVHWSRKKLPLINSLVNVAQGRPPFYPLMPMNVYNLNSICEVLQARGCTTAALLFSQDHDYRSAFIIFQKSCSQG
jgi:trans-aconitate methyltransferase